jgi:hypothetical protein
MGEPGCVVVKFTTDLLHRPTLPAERRRYVDAMLQPSTLPCR